MGSILDVLTGWALFAGLCGALGGCFARALIVPRAELGGPERSAHLRRIAGRLAFGGALLLLPAMALFFLRQLLEFRDPFVPWAEDAGLLLGTAWGVTWVRGVVGAALGAVSLGLAARGSAAGWWVGGVIVLALGAFPALTGHATGSDQPVALTLGADALHVWAASGWLGGLAFVLAAERGWRGERSLLPELVPVFSRVAVVCVATLVVTGGFGAWVHVPELSALTGTPYGRTLVVKLGLVALVLGLGFVNWRVLTPNLNEAAGRDEMRRVALVELLVGQAVLAVTAVLVRTSPPMS